MLQLMLMLKLMVTLHKCRQAVAWKALNELARPALHAQTLGFTHPITGARMQFTSDLPLDFQQTLTYLTQSV